MIGGGNPKVSLNIQVKSTRREVRGGAAVILWRRAFGSFVAAHIAPPPAHAARVPPLQPLATTSSCPSLEHHRSRREGPNRRTRHSPTWRAPWSPPSPRPATPTSLAKRHPQSPIPICPRLRTLDAACGSGSVKARTGGRVMGCSPHSYHSRAHDVDGGEVRAGSESPGSQATAPCKPQRSECPGTRQTRHFMAEKAPLTPRHHNHRRHR